MNQEGIIDIVETLKAALDQYNKEQRWTQSSEKTLLNALGTAVLAIGDELFQMDR